MPMTLPVCAKALHANFWMTSAHAPEVLPSTRKLDRDLLVVAPSKHRDGVRAPLHINASPSQKNRVLLAQQVAATTATASLIAAAVACNLSGLGVIISASIGCGAAAIFVASQVLALKSFKSDVLLVTKPCLDPARPLWVQSCQAERYWAQAASITVFVATAASALMLAGALLGAPLIPTFWPLIALPLLGCAAGAYLGYASTRLALQTAWKPFNVHFQSGSGWPFPHKTTR